MNNARVGLVEEIEIVFNGRDKKWNEIKFMEKKKKKKKIDKQETTFELFQDIWWLF